MYKVFLFLAALLALNGMDYQPIADPFRDGKIRYMLLMLVPVIFVWLKKELTFSPAFFAALALLSYVNNNYQYFGEFPLLLILATTLMAVCLVRLGEESFAWLLIISGVFQAMLGLMQFFHVYWYFYPASPAMVGLPVGFMGNGTVLGSFLVAALCPALWRGRWFCSLLMILVIILSDSQMAWGALGGVLTLFVWNRYTFRHAVAFAFSGLAILGICILTMPHSPALDFNGRWFIWEFGLRAFRESPYLGSGIGSWAGFYLPKYKDEILNTFHYHVPVELHCDYFDFLVEYGLIAGLVFLYPFTLFLRNFRPSWTHAVCAGILVNAAASFPLCLPTTGAIFVAAWAYSNRKPIGL